MVRGIQSTFFFIMKLWVCDVHRVNVTWEKGGRNNVVKSMQLHLKQT